MKREKFYEAVVAAVQLRAGAEVGNGVIPEQFDDCYCIVMPPLAGGGDGSWADPEEERDFVFSITSVGTSVRQVSWLSRRVEDAITARGPNGDYATPITGDGFTVTRRSVNALGAAVPSGTELWQCVDSYRIRAGE